MNIAIALSTLALAGGVTPTEGVQLGTHGHAVAGQAGAGTRVAFTAKALKPGSSVRALLQAGTCKQRSASFASLGSARVAANGTAKWTARALFHGEQVAWSTVSDGGHVIVLIADGKVVGCGAVPGMS